MTFAVICDLSCSVKAMELEDVCWIERINTMYSTFCISAGLEWKSFHEKPTHLLNLEVKDCDEIWHTCWSLYQLFVYNLSCFLFKKLGVGKSLSLVYTNMYMRFIFNNSFDNALRETF
jgi:hypothetical protein